jgi:hypothetical protein
LYLLLLKFLVIKTLDPDSFEMLDPDIESGSAILVPTVDQAKQSCFFSKIFNIVFVFVQVPDPGHHGGVRGGPGHALSQGCAPTLVSAPVYPLGPWTYPSV